MSHHHPHAISRRRFVIACAGASFLSACGRTPGHTTSATAAEIDTTTVCMLSGLRLSDFAGPKAQIHRVGRTDPEFYSDTVKMFHVFLATSRRQDISGMFVQDMGKTDWFAPHGHWIDATTAHYVRGSSKFGPMGPTFASFSTLSNADDFAREFGGELLRFADVDADMVVLDGGALHDMSM